MKNYLIITVLGTSVLFFTQIAPGAVFINKNPQLPKQELPVIIEESNSSIKPGTTNTTINITLNPQLTLDTPNAVATAQVSDDQTPKKSHYISLMYFVILLRTMLPPLPFPY